MRTTTKGGMGDVGLELAKIPEGNDRHRAERACSSARPSSQHPVNSEPPGIYGWNRKGIEEKGKDKSLRGGPISSYRGRMHMKKKDKKEG